jgi:hypothetical protein
MYQEVRVSIVENGKLKLDPNGGVLWNIPYDEALVKIEEHNSYLTKDKDKWDITKIDEETKNELKRLYKDKNYSEIILIHNKLKLSGMTYCCEKHITLINKNISELL